VPNVKGMFFYLNFISSLESCFCPCGPHQFSFNSLQVAVSLIRLAVFFFIPHHPVFFFFFFLYQPGFVLNLFCLVCRWMDFCFYMYANISGKVQRVEPLGHVMAAKIPE